MKRFARPAWGAAACAGVVLAVSACGSSGPSSGPSSSTPTTIAGLRQTGAGLTQGTAPSGSKISGGTVTLTEGASAPPNYIFPMYSPQVCSVVNVAFEDMMYRPLYWYGNNNTPTVDYNYSVGNAPTFSNNDKTVTITLKPWKWSDGEPVSARDLVFWMNVLKANPATEFCGYVPTLFPDNVVSYSAPNPSTFVLNLNRSYNPTWFTYNELSQISPLPLAWDRTSLSQPAPTTDNGHLPDTTKAGAAAIYKFLDTQAKDLGSYGSNPLWKVVNGPWRIQSLTSTGEATLVPNPAWSGTPKPTISKFVEVPFTSDTAIFNEIRAGGPGALTIAALPAQDVPQLSSVTAEGYTDLKASGYSFNYFVINFNNPTLGPVFRQLYFRQAFQSLIDQQGWIHAFLNNTAVPTYSPVPTVPPSPLVSVGTAGPPYPFSTAKAASYLSNNGWHVVPGGTTTCVKPGTASGDCGAGITKGEGISFNLDFESGVATLTSEMNDLAAQAKKVGITLNLTTHPFATVIGSATNCKPTAPSCKWTAENWGAGWIYAPDYLPTGESLYMPHAVSNYGGYSDPKAVSLINQTIFGPASGEKAAMTAYNNYISQQLPVIFGPTSIGDCCGGSDGGDLISNKLGGYTANAFELLNPEDWYLTK
jgi:peptide/nickel transport system substrate-binding protein